MSADPGRVRVGISGWTYAPWRGVFYPKELRRSSQAELAYASRAFQTIEINGSFYSLQRPESYLRWSEDTPDEFVFAVKANRYITHTLRLVSAEKALANFFASGLLSLGEKLGPILWQLPPSFKYDPERMKRFLRLLPRSTRQASLLAEQHDPWMNGRAYIRSNGRRPIRHALEVRHESFREPGFLELLRKQNIALVISHSSGKWPLFEELTSDFVYIRLHGQGELYSGGYGARAIRNWGERILAWSGGPQPRDVYVYFDNDAKVRAPFDAIRLIEFVENSKRNISVSRAA